MKLICSMICDVEYDWTIFNFCRMQKISSEIQHICNAEFDWMFVKLLE